MIKLCSVRKVMTDMVPCVKFEFSSATCEALRILLMLLRNSQVHYCDGRYSRRRTRECSLFLLGPKP